MSPYANPEDTRAQRLDDVERRLGELEEWFIAERTALHRELAALRTVEAEAEAAARAQPSERRCPSCGEPARADAWFCTACGTALGTAAAEQSAAPAKPAPAEPPYLLCPGCGLGLALGTSECPNCGEVLGEQATTRVPQPPEPAPPAAQPAPAPPPEVPAQAPTPAAPSTPPVYRPPQPASVAARGPSRPEPTAPWLPRNVKVPSFAEIAQRLTATMVLAWLGAIIATLGLTFLFIVAAQRGWFTPPLRLAAGTLVSLGLLGFSIRYQRRDGSLWGVLAAAGTGIAGLYITIYAATEVYSYIGEPVALGLVGAVAVLGTAVALLIDAQPIAIFAVSAAILAPLSVSRDVTSAGVAFAAVIGCIGLATLLRRGWTLVIWATLVVGYPQVVVLGLSIDPHVGGWMIGPVLFVGLWAGAMYLYALRKEAPRHLDELTIALASSAATALAVVGYRAGDPWDGWVTLAAGAILMAGATLPWAIGRSHPDLADLLGAYALSVIAIAMGLLLHGSALTAGWAVEAGALAIVADRLRRRDDEARLDRVTLTRADRLHLGATGYLALAVGAAVLSSPPTDLAVHSWGSREGLVGLIALIAGATAWAYATAAATQWPKARRWASAVPVAVAVYATPFLLAGEWVIIGWSVLSTALAAAVVNDRARRWVGETQAVACGVTVLAIAAAMAVAQFAQPNVAFSVDQWGSHHGLLALSALLMASIGWAACASIRIRAQAWRAEYRWASAVPVAVAVYATPFLLAGEWVIVAWSLLSTALAAGALIDRPRRWIGGMQCVDSAGAVLGLATIVSLAQFAQPKDAFAVDQWGNHHGLVSLAALLGTSMVWAVATLRNATIWPRWPILVPAALATYLVPFALPGEWVVLTWSMAALALAGMARWRLTATVIQPVEAFGLAAGLLMLGAGVTMANFATLTDATTIANWGSDTGLLSLAALLTGSTALAASVMVGDEVPQARWSTTAPVAVAVYATVFVLSGDSAIIAWTGISALVAATLYWPAGRAFFGEDQLLTESSLVLMLAIGVATYYDRLARQVVVDSGAHRGVAVSLCTLATSLLIVFAIRSLQFRTTALRAPIVLACLALTTLFPDIWAAAGWAAIALLLVLLVDEMPTFTAKHLDLRILLESGAWLAVLVGCVSVAAFETPRRLFWSNPSPAWGIASIATVAAALWVSTRAMRRHQLTIFPRRAQLWVWASASAVASMWTVTAAILGAAEARDGGPGNVNVESHFQQGQVAVSITWCAIGLLLLYLGYRHRSRGARTAGVVLLFATPAKLFLYDLAFLPPTARAASFIVTGLVLIGAAFLMQRLGSKDARPEGPTTGEGPSISSGRTA